MNQRNGYYIPAGVKYNTLSWTEAGTTDKAYPVIGYIGQDPLIAVNGTNYIVGKSVQVPGYCAAGYTVDRWFLEQPYNLKIDATGLHFTPSNLDSYTNLIQQISVEKWTILNGKTITVSALTSDGKLLSESGTWTPESGPVVRFDNFEFSSAAFVNAPSYQLGRLYVYAGKSADVLAVKVELGSTQTLAHQENGVWVLNEIPDHESQLLSCCMSKADSDDSYANNKTIPAMFGAAVGYKILSDDDDLNTLYVSGMYRASGATKNCPAAYGQVLVVSGGGDTVAQLYLPWDVGQKVMFRGGNLISSGGGWTDWTEVITGRTIANQTVNSAKYAGTREWNSYNLKDEKLHWSEETPTEQGTICWIY